ncbi:MAG: hypothetical protein RBS77_01705 [Candidatus Moranbacteria bacterium]|jgi:hypothetical protein|nr:hypothetical protein [Candidatus Moranbacteria bacterium]
MENKIKQIQTAIFVKNFNIINDVEKANFLMEINNNVNSVFNGQPSLSPVPNDAPYEFPRLSLSSLDGRFKCNVALSRVDIFYNVPLDSNDNLEQLLETQKNNSELVFNFLIGRGIIVNRTGFIVVIDKELDTGDGNNVEYLRNNFIKDDKFKNPKELILNYNCLGGSGNFDMNNLILIKSDFDNKIFIQTDINTVAEIMDTANLNLNNYREVIDYSIKKTQEIINDFPNI